VAGGVLPPRRGSSTPRWVLLSAVTVTVRPSARSLKRGQVRPSPTRLRLPTAFAGGNDYEAAAGRVQLWASSPLRRVRCAPRFLSTCSWAVGGVIL
jgi:hypothetical protein